MIFAAIESQATGAPVSVPKFVRACEAKLGTV
jgi:hypothetical protein